MNAAIDAAVFLLLLGAAVVGLTTADLGAQQTPDDARADAVANVLGTSTATVNYTLAPGAREANESGFRFDRTEGPAFERTTHGSLAGLLARAAVGTAGFGGGDIDRADDSDRPKPLTHARGDFRSAVRETVTTRVAPVGLRIDAVWRPYPDAPVAGRVAVGESPPETARTDAATLSIPTGTRGLAANETRDFDSLAAAVAARTVETLAPASRTRLALRGEAPVSTLVRYRYARLGEELNATVEPSVADAETRAANDRLARALAPRVESDLRRRYDSPERAAEAVTVSEVRIVVRTWTPADGREVSR